MVNSSRAARTTARSMRTGSSRNRTSGFADAADQPRVQIFEAADVIDDRERPDVVEEGVDREIAAEGVFLGGAVGVVPLDQAILRAPGVELERLVVGGRGRREHAVQLGLLGFGDFRLRA